MWYNMPMVKNEKRGEAVIQFSQAFLSWVMFKKCWLNYKVMVKNNEVKHYYVTDIFMATIDVYVNITNYY